MKDLGSIMKQAQAMQQKLADAQARIAEIVVEGTSGGGMVKVTLRGTGELLPILGYGGAWLLMAALMAAGTAGMALLHRLERKQRRV